MPAINFDQGPRTLLPCDVVGKRTDAQTRFVRHVGLFDEDRRSVTMGDDVRVLHMGPPIERNTIKAHTGGCVPLYNKQIKKIRTWYEKVKDESSVSTLRQYVIRPAWKDETDPNTGVRRYRRYSCAGFVLDGHRQVDIELLDIDDDKLPAVNKQTIISAYPEAERHPDLLLYWGLEDWELKDDKSWKVVLAGYVLHALNRPTDQIRQEAYQAKEGDEQF
jgi:hypothetical protein